MAHYCCTKYRCTSCNSVQWFSLTCPTCGMVGAEVITESGEEPSPPQAIRIIGDIGEPLIFRYGAPYPMNVGRPLLEDISSGGKYASSCQFILSWRDELVFIAISPYANPSCELLLNGSPLHNKSELHHGDRLKLRGKASGREAMEIVIEFV